MNGLDVTLLDVSGTSSDGGMTAGAQAGPTPNCSQDGAFTAFVASVKYEP